MNSQSINKIIAEVATSLEIPPSAYEKAEARYKDLGEWFSRPQATCFGFDPHIYPQGSFRLGTVVRPLHEEADYDLDLGCRLRSGISKTTHTQKQLKDFVGGDLETYRNARRIESKLEEMHRCWRLQYADELSFHMDVVPSIPEDQQQRAMLKEAMVKAASLGSPLADAVSSHAGAITDDRHQDYKKICTNWRISNSEGYALWFESRMKLATELLQEHAAMAKVAKVDDLPARKWNSPLQQAIKVLKRHRDVMFKDDTDSQPISIVLTTLAAAAYRGEPDTISALNRILSDMGKYVQQSKPRVPNPVNPAEDFADKWYDPKYQHLRLEENFWSWLKQAQADLHTLQNTQDAKLIIEQAATKFATTLDASRIKDALGVLAVSVAAAPKIVSIHTPAKPWAVI